MSKVDAMRALREARRSAASKAGVRLAPAAGRQAVEEPVDARPARTPVRATAEVQPAEAPAAEAPDALCGHRNMGGRSCTRELDHVRNGTKNHRYG